MNTYKVTADICLDRTWIHLDKIAAIRIDGEDLSGNAWPTVYQLTDREAVDAAIEAVTLPDTRASDYLKEFLWDELGGCVDPYENDNEDVIITEVN